MHWYKRSQNYFVEMTQDVDVDNDNDIDMQFKKNISWTYNNSGFQTCPKTQTFLKWFGSDPCDQENTYSGYLDKMQGVCMIIPPREVLSNMGPLPRPLIQQLQQAFGPMSKCPFAEANSPENQILSN